MIYDYRVSELVRAVDGDTYDLTLHKRMDFGFRLIEDKYWSARFRLYNPGFYVDAFESNQPGGAAATAYARSWITSAIFDDVCRGVTYKTDNFGRWLIDLFRIDSLVHLADLLRSEGYTKPAP